MASGKTFHLLLFEGCLSFFRDNLRFMLPHIESQAGNLCWFFVVIVATKNSVHWALQSMLLHCECIENGIKAALN